MMNSTKDFIFSLFHLFMIRNILWWKNLLATLCTVHFRQLNLECSLCVYLLDSNLSWFGYQSEGREWECEWITVWCCETVWWIFYFRWMIFVWMVSVEGGNWRKQQWKNRIYTMDGSNTNEKQLSKQQQQQQQQRVWKSTHNCVWSAASQYKLDVRSNRNARTHNSPSIANQTELVRLIPYSPAVASAAAAAAVTVVAVAVVLAMGL